MHATEPPARPSNTQTTDTKSGPSGPSGNGALSEHLRIDKLRLKTTFPADNPVYTQNFGGPDWWARKDLSAQTRQPMTWPGGYKIFVEALQREPEFAVEITMEFNPNALVATSDYPFSVTAHELPKVLRSVERFLAFHGIRDVNLDLARLRRLDIARDFVIEAVSIPRLIEALERVNLGRRKRRARYSGSRGAQALYTYPGLDNSHTRRSKAAWQTRLYDAGARHGDQILDASRLRWELEAGPKVLKKYDLCYLVDITPQACEMLAHKYWEQTKTGSSVTPTGEVMRLLEADGVSCREAGNTLGYLHARDLQRPGFEYSAALRSKHEKRLQRVGVDALAPDDHTHGHLCLVRGIFVHG